MSLAGPHIPPQQVPRLSKAGPKTSALEEAAVTERPALDGPSPLSGAIPPTALASRGGGIQPKLEVGPVDDAYEREADSVADQVVQRMVQPKLEVGPVDDAHEREADGVADQVVQRMALGNVEAAAQVNGPQTVAQASLPVVQRVAAGRARVQAKCAACEQMQQEGEHEEHEEGEGRVQRMAGGGSPADDEDEGQPSPPVQRKCAKCAEEEKVQAKHAEGGGGNAVLGRQLRSRQGLGSPLPAQYAGPMGQALGSDLSPVRLHTDGQAAQMAKSINALAFTHGRDIYFGQGQYNPSTRGGMHLLAHELVHTVQQGATTSMLGIQRVEDRIQRTCAELAREFKGSDYGSAEGRAKMEKRIKECAQEDFGKAKTELDKMPNSPGDNPSTAAKFAELKKTVEEAIKSVAEHKNVANKIIRTEHLKMMLNRLTTHKLSAYAMIGAFDHNKLMASALGDAEITMDTNQLVKLQKNTTQWKDNPEEVVMRQFTKPYYDKLGLDQPAPTEQPSWKKHVGGLAANAPAFPAWITGQDTLTRKSTGTYTMQLDWSIEGKDLLSMTAAAMNYVYYTWEVYDVTKHYEQTLKEKAEAMVKAKESGTVDDGPTMSQVGMRNAELQAVDPANESTEAAARERRREHLVNQQIEQFKNNWEDLKDPSNSSDGTVIGNVTTRLLAGFNLAGTQLAAEFAALGELLSTVADLMGNKFYEREIPFPDRDGFFLVRCIARPKPYGKDDKLTIRRPSVSSKVVKVREIKAYTQEQVADIDKNLEARRIETENNLKLATDEKEKERLQKELNNIKREQTGQAEDILAQQIEQLEEAEKNEKGFLRKKELKKKIEALKAQQKTANERKAEFKGSTQVRPRAVFVSEERGETVPLLLQVGEIKNTALEQIGPMYRVSDVTGKDGDNYDAQGKDAPEAIHNAFKAFAAASPYGIGYLSVKMPDGATIALKESQYRCIAKGSKQAMDRLEQAITVMTILATLAVPGVGEVAMIAGAVIAAQRIYHRIQNHTFAWDATTVSDILTLVGAAAQGAAVIGKMRVVKASKQFALVADDADVAKFIAGLNRTASRLELISELSNWGSFFYGATNTLHEYLTIQADEIAGRISKAEARRRKAHLIAGAIRDGALQFASVDPAAMKDKIDGSFGGDKPKANEHAQTPEHAPAKDGEAKAGSDKPHDKPVAKDSESKAPADKPAVAAEKPQDKPPVKDGEQKVPTDKPQDPPAKDGDAKAADDAKLKKPADAAIDGPGNSTAPPAKLKLAPDVVEGHLKALEKKLGSMPEGLRDLLMHDHELLKRAAEDKSVITKKNKEAWNEIGQLMPMAPETYQVLLDNPAMRKALMNNEFARAVLKHCASPCFPPNATPKNITDIQAILLRLQGKKGIKKEDIRAINDFLYAHRNGDLTAAIEVLKSITDPSEIREQLGKFAAKDYEMPSGWKMPEPGTKSTPFEGVMHYGKDVPKGLMNEVLKHMATVAPDATGNQMADLRTVLKRAAEAGTMPPEVNKLLYGLANKAHFEVSLKLLEGMVRQQEKMTTILKKLSVADLHLLDGGHMPISKETIDSLSKMMEHINMKDVTVESLIMVIEQSGYPAPKKGETNVDIRRLVELLKKLKPGEELTPSQVQIKIAESNEAIDNVSKHNFKLGFDKTNFDKDYSTKSKDVNLQSDLKAELHSAMLKDPAILKLAEKTSSAETGNKMRAGQGDFATFSAITNRMRDMLKTFLTKTIRDKVEADAKRALGKDTLTKAEFDAHVETLINQAFGTTRGNYFEVFAKEAHAKAIAKEVKNKTLDAGSKSMGEYALGVKQGSGKDASVTYPDTTNVEVKGDTAKIVFFEYKTGGSEIRPGQETLRDLVKNNGGDPTKILPKLDFDSPKAKELQKTIEDLQKAGKKISFDYITIEENPSKKK